MFIGQFGLAAWDQVQKEVIEIRKEIERQRYAEEKARAAKIEEIKEAAVVGFIVLGVLMVMLIVGAMFLERIN